MQPTILLLGGNDVNTRTLIKQALLQIEQGVGEIIGYSSLYQSPPWGFDHENWFLNQVLVVQSLLSPLDLLDKTQQIERQLGRKKKTTTHYEGRPIDIDILFMGNQIHRLPRLEVPHPRLHLRRFTLVPLCELEAAFVHPVLGRTLLELLESCPDKSEVQKVI